VLILPIGGAFFFRFYENELVRQTEMELISQAAVISAVYKNTLAKSIKNPAQYGVDLPNYAPPVIDEKYQPVPPQLDLSKIETMPPRPEPVVTTLKAGKAELAAAKSMEAVLAETRKVNLSGIRILDYQGIVVSVPAETGLSLADFPEVKQGLQGHYTSVIRERISDSPTPALSSISRGTNIRVFVVYPVIENSRLWGVLYLSRTPKNILKYLYGEGDRVVLAGGMILTITLLLALLTSYTISRPIYRLIEQTRNITKSGMGELEPLDRPVIKEVELLSDSFTRMAHALQERSDYMRNFAMHVSHEFKTPLTSIRGSAELLQDYDDLDPKEKANFLSLILQNTDRLKSLVSRLLELARADSIVPSNETVNLGALLANLDSRYRMEGLGLVFDRSIQQDVRISQENLETIFINLLNNAKQHEAFAVEIEIKDRGEALEIDIRDNGKGISPANRDKVFTPFFTTRRDTGGTGLGLDIIRSIAEKHGGEIILGTSVSGARFILTLPKSSVKAA